MQDHLSSPSLSHPDALAHRMVQCAHNRDGLPEMLVGFCFLVASVMNGISFVVHGYAAVALFFVFAVLITVLGSTANRIVAWTRRRFLLQWVGYVQLRPCGRTAIIVTFLVAAAVAGSAAFALRHVQPSAQLIVLTAGVGVGILQVLIGRIARFWITGGLILCAAVAIAIANWSMELSLAVFFLCAGGINLIAGGFTFLRLIQQRAETGA